MSAVPLVPKKPKAEEREEEADGEVSENGTAENISISEQEEALVALIEHRTKEVEHLRKRIAYYKSQLDQAESRLEDSKSKLARIRIHDSVISSKSSRGDGIKDFKVKRRSISPIQIIRDSTQNQPQSRPQLVIPAVNPKISSPMKMVGSLTNDSSSQVQARKSRMTVLNPSNSDAKLTEDKYHKTPSEQEATEVHDKGTKRKFGKSFAFSQIKRYYFFCECALDGVVNLWQVQARGSSASLLSSTDSISPKQRRWPEDIAWHPEGSSLFSAYSADSGDSQISVLNLNKKKGEARVRFLDVKPHVKGIINNIVFMPWDNVCFVTGGSDHAVMLWIEKEENSWKPKALHRSLHSSAVMGVAGMQQKQIVLSAGADKRIIGFDLSTERVDYKHQIDSKCMSILPNPCDFNLFMVQTGTPERQLRLFDIRLRQTEIHAFGWKQESSESQSALINQAWSPDGLYITSGSADPVIHIFDIRYNAHKPSQSVKATSETSL
ncbi:transducin family protein [Actinidia rufa]|uniref:Transducin family protein n=1 Tax=Actinidia rufa TaxID=165716 RepID=A0A7J0FZG2_9ERIC|nr:transducin family protein [Actinidia rufa]